MRINQDEVTTADFLWGRWEWMFSLPYLDTGALSRIGVWEEGGEIVAVVTYEAETGVAWFLTDRGHVFLHQGMLRYALDNLTRDGAIKVLIEDTDDDLPRIAVAHGLTRTQDVQPNSALDLTGDLSYPLPDGYRIASLTDDGDLHRLNRVLHRGFNNPGDVPVTPEAIQERQTSVSGPHLNRDLNITVVAPDGEYAAYCGIWQDPATDLLVTRSCRSELHRSYAPRQIRYLCQNRALGQGSAMYWNCGQISPHCSLALICHAVDVKKMDATTEHPMVDWEPITYKDLIILTEWMAQQDYSAARLAEAVREPAKYTEELRAVVRHNSDTAARQKEQDKVIQKQAAAEFMAARAAKHVVDTPALSQSRRAGPERVAGLLT